MRYYNVNIKHFADPANPNGDRVSHARQWLDQRQRVPIFFGRTTIEGILGDGAGLPAGPRREARAFCEIGRNHDMWDDITFVTIDEGTVWTYRPCGAIEEEEIDTYPGELPKSLPVEILARTSVRDVPLVLAGMRANQAFSRTTFREIEPVQYPGNVIAIACGCGRDDGDLLPEGIRPVDLIDCLSSVELETLVAKLFEHSNCFVPAYKGGFVPDIDLIVENDGANRLFLDGLDIPVRGRRTVQVKIRSENPNADRGAADYLITASDIAPTHNCFGRAWIRRRLEAAPPVSRWLKRSTDWVPARLFG